MPTVSYTITINTGINQSKSNGGTIGCTITKNGVVPAGSSVVSAMLYVSAIQTYVSTGSFTFGVWGTTGMFNANSSTHAANTPAYLNDDILNISSAGLTQTVRSESSNAVLSVRSGCTMSLSVTYSESYGSSTGSLSSSSVDAGTLVSLSISNANINNQKHTVMWQLGTSSIYTHTQTLDKGVASTSYTIPQSWINGITSSSYGSASVTLQTYSGTKLIGQRIYNFTVNVPITVVPTITSFTTTRVNNVVPAAWGVYVQGKSKVQLSVSATTQYGASVISYSIVGDGYIGTTNTFTTDTIRGSGTITYTARVTDSRGRTAEQTTSIEVFPYSPPTISNILAQRCEVDGTPNENGTYGKAKSTISVSSCDGNNIVKTYKVYYKQYGEDDTSYVLINGAAISGVEDIFGENNLNTLYSYVVKFEVTDEFSTTVYLADITTAGYTMFFKAGGKGIAFGQVANIDNAVIISPNWDLLLGSINVGNKLLSVPVYSETDEPANKVTGMVWLKKAT